MSEQEPQSAPQPRCAVCDTGLFIVFNANGALSPIHEDGTRDEDHEPLFQTQSAPHQQ